MGGDETGRGGGVRVSARLRRGRGALSNAASRYEPERMAVDDGWGVDPDDDLPPLKTTVTADASRTIIARNQSPDISFDRSINPYRGCEHGCVYCFARPTHAWLGLSPGLDFETRLFAKPRAAELLDAELRAPSYAPRVIAIGTNTDPYQPVERTLRVTRSILEVLDRFNHPVGITTKGARVVRDIDILGPMAARRLAKVAISVTTLDAKRARAMEPRAPAPEKRLAAIRDLSAAGIPVAVMVAPLIPGLTDHEIEPILERAADAGATQAGYVLLRLPLELKEVVAEWLRDHCPDRADRVLNLLRDMRGGKDYDARWGLRQTGTGPYARFIADRFRVARTRFGLDRRSWSYDMSLFRPPPRAGDQLNLLDP